MKGNRDVIGIAALTASVLFILGLMYLGLWVTYEVFWG